MTGSAAAEGIPADPVSIIDAATAARPNEQATEDIRTFPSPP
jgi:hypothetical protein